MDSLFSYKHNFYTAYIILWLLSVKCCQMKKCKHKEQISNITRFPSDLDEQNKLLTIMQ